MNYREAFEDALLYVWGMDATDFSTHAYLHAERLWCAACEWQKQKDAAIANKFIGCDPIVELILNQGKGERRE